MQKNVVIGNIARITEIPDSNRKVYMSVADHYGTKNKDTGKYEKKTRFVPVEGFLPEGLNLKVGQLVAVEFTVNQYQKKDGSWAIGLNIDRIDVTLNNIGKKDDAESADAGEATAEEEVPPFSAEEAAAAEEGKTSTGKKNK